MPAPPATNANEVIEHHLDLCVQDLEKELNADVVAICGGFTFGADNTVRTVVEDRSNKRHNLAVLLETPGGFIEVVQRVADTFRHHYRHVEFIVPNYALSAGTVLALSGDKIHMDYFSILGPVDPQLPRPDGTLVPALGYLIQYERLIKKSRVGKLSAAEVTFLVEKFDPAELYRFEQQRELTIALIEDWLVKYKFKNWKQTRTRKIAVTAVTRKKRATEIAKILNDTDRWHSHGRGIPMNVLRRDLKLEIDDFGAVPALAIAIRNYYRLLMDYWIKTGQMGFVHTLGQWAHLHG